MGIPWKNDDMRDRLLASVIASFSSKVDVKGVARIFGMGATYDAVEGQLRKAKTLSKTLSQEAKGREGPAQAAPRVKKAKGVSLNHIKAPVKGSRVSKPKKEAKSKIKTEDALSGGSDEEV